MFPFPTVSLALLEKLTELFPDRLPLEPQSVEMTALLIGRQDVIRKLRVEYDRQQNNILGSK